MAVKSVALGLIELHLAPGALDRGGEVDLMLAGGSIPLMRGRPGHAA